MGFRERFSLSATADEERNQYDRDRQPDQEGREAVANLAPAGVRVVVRGHIGSPVGVGMIGAVGRR